MAYISSIGGVIAKANMLTLAGIAVGKVSSINGVDFWSAAQDTFTQSLGSNDNGQENRTLRVIIPAASATTSGAQVRVTFEASGAAAWNCDNLAIGVRSGSSADCTATPVELLFSGASGFSISAGQSLTSDWATFAFNEAVDHLVIMDVSSTNGNNKLNGSTLSGYYFKLATDSYNTATLSGATSNAAFVGVNKIEVRS